MSYILEGLKKLEQKRQQEKGSPDLLAFQTESLRKPEKRAVWPYLLIAVFLINAGVVIWLAGPWRTAGRNTPVQTSSIQQNPSKTAVVAPETKSPEKTVPAKELQQPKAAEIPPAPSVRKETKEIPRSATKETPVSRQSPVVASVSPDPSRTSAKNKPPAGGHTVKLSELPSEIRNSLPVLKMSAHFYSTDKQARFARINDRILHEGEHLTDGLTMEEINSGGAVFSYKGYRFLMGINDK